MKWLKNVIFLVLLFIIPLIILSGIGLYRHHFVRNKENRSSYIITINNTTNKEVNGLQIGYRDIAENIKLPIIPPKTTSRVEVDTLKSTLGENSMWIMYKDKSGNEHKEIIIGYFEKGIGGRQSISITSIEENGKIIFKKG